MSNQTSDLVGHILPGVAYIALCPPLWLFAYRPAALGKYARRILGVIILLTSFLVFLGYSVTAEGFTNPHRPVEMAFVPLGISLLPLERERWVYGLFATMVLQYLFYSMHDHAHDDGSMQEEMAHEYLGKLYWLASLSGAAALYWVEAPKAKDEKPRTVYVSLDLTIWLLFLQGLWMIVLGSCLYGGQYGVAGADWPYAGLAFNWLLVLGVSVFSLRILL